MIIALGTADGMNRSAHVLSLCVCFFGGSSHLYTMKFTIYNFEIHLISYIHQSISSCICNCIRYFLIMVDICACCSSGASDVTTSTYKDHKHGQHVQYVLWKSHLFSLHIPVRWSKRILLPAVHCPLLPWVATGGHDKTEKKPWHFGRNGPFGCPSHFDMWDALHPRTPEHVVEGWWSFLGLDSEPQAIHFVESHWAFLVLAEGHAWGCAVHVVVAPNPMWFFIHKGLVHHISIGHF